MSPAALAHRRARGHNRHNFRYIGPLSATTSCPGSKMAVFQWLLGNRERRHAGPLRRHDRRPFRWPVPCARRSETEREYATALTRARSAMACPVCRGTAATVRSTSRGHQVGNGASRRRAHAAGVQFVVLVQFNALPEGGTVRHIISKEISGRTPGDFLGRVEDNGSLLINFPRGT